MATGRYLLLCSDGPIRHYILLPTLTQDNQHKEGHASVKEFIADKRLWLLAGIYFCVVMANTPLHFAANSFVTQVLVITGISVCSQAALYVPLWS